MTSREALQVECQSALCMHVDIGLGRPRGERRQGARVRRARAAGAAGTLAPGFSRPRAIANAPSLRVRFPTQCEPLSPLTITAEGASVSKAVTVAEISKRRLRGLHQNTQIGLGAPVEGNARRRSPTILITLSLAPLDTTAAGCGASRLAHVISSARLIPRDACVQVSATSHRRRARGRMAHRRGWLRAAATAAAASACAAVTPAARPGV